MTSSTPPADSNEPSDRPAPPATAYVLDPDVWIARGDLRWSYSRSSGPGGQNVNKVNTRAELRVNIARINGLTDGARARLRTLCGSRIVGEDEICLTAEETRSQLNNREACLGRLRDLVQKARVAPKTRRKTKPTRGSKERRLEGKRRTSQRKSNRRRPDE